MIIKEICNIKKKTRSKEFVQYFIQNRGPWHFTFSSLKKCKKLPHNKIIVYYSNYYIGVFWVFFITRKINNERCMFF